MNYQPEPQTRRREQIDWLQECLDVSRRMNDALTRNDLEALEGCLDMESTLFPRRPDFRTQDAAIPGSTAQEIRSLNDRNRALIHNGFDFARTLLDVLRPPATYSSLGPGVPQPTTSDEPRISVKC